MGADVAATVLIVALNNSGVNVAIDHQSLAAFR
jgi:hypothetical protein